MCPENRDKVPLKRRYRSHVNIKSYSKCIKLYVLTQHGEEYFQLSVMFLMVSVLYGIHHSSFGTMNRPLAGRNINRGFFPGNGHKFFFMSTARAFALGITQPTVQQIPGVIS